MLVSSSTIHVAPGAIRERPTTDVEAGRFTRCLASEVTRCLQVDNRVAIAFARVHGIGELTVESGPTTRARVLGDLVGVWRRRLRAHDALFHTGNDEFVLLCSRLTDPVQAMTLADTLREMTASHQVVPFARPPLSLSVTVAFLGG